MQIHRLTPSVITYSALISVREKGARRERALELFGGDAGAAADAERHQVQRIDQRASERREARECFGVFEAMQ